MNLSQIARDVLAYLAEHPQARDTQEGITRWWLLEQQILQRTAEIESALVELVSKGLVTDRRGSDGRIHYRINPSRREDIAGLFKGERTRPKES